MLRLLNIFILLFLKGGLAVAAKNSDECAKYEKYTEDYECDSKLIKCYTVKEEIKYDFKKDELIYYNKRFFKDLRTFLIFPDFNQDRESDDVKDMISAFYQRYNTGRKRHANMVVCEYGSVIEGKCFKQSVKNLSYIGKCVAKIINALVEVGLYVIGNGIGAALMKPFGLRYNTSEIIRTTALDPAGSIYGVPDTDLISLEKTNISHYRDCFHTNGNKYAIKCGISDFYYNLDRKIQPGCENGTELEQKECSHERMMKYYTASIRDEEEFYGFICDYVKPDYDKKCPNVNAWFPSGFATRIIEHGEFQVNTRASPPYGYGEYENKTEETQTEENKTEENKTGFKSGGQAGVNSGGQAGVNSGGQAGVKSGGQAGVKSGGQAGVKSGGQAGVHSGGQAGVHSGGQAGVHSGGQAGVNSRGQAGVNSGGQAGVKSGGQAGVHSGGQAGVHSGGQAGVHSGGQAGVHSGGQAGVHSGRRAGVHSGRRAGVNSGRRAGVNSGGQAGVNSGGQAGVNSGGQAGVKSGGQAGVKSGGQAGVHSGGQAGFKSGVQAGVKSGGQAGFKSG